MGRLSHKDLDKVVIQAEDIASGHGYDAHETTARNHAALQALQIKVNGELIKTIRELDAKNGRLQKIFLFLSLVICFSAVVTLLKG